MNEEYTKYELNKNMNKIINFEKENDYGNIEYKLKLVKYFKLCVSI